MGIRSLLAMALVDGAFNRQRVGAALDTRKKAAAEIKHRVSL
jgi:hypothetical protein